MHIKIDTRESFSTKATMHRLCDCTETTLLVGDFLINDVVCFEHKKPADFISSIFDNRMFDQIVAMKENYHYNYIMVSGSISDIMVIADAKGFRASMVGAICSCYVRGVPVVFCESMTNMAELMIGLGNKHADGNARTRPIVKKSVEDKRIQVLCSLDGVSTKIAYALLHRFGNVRAVFAATEDELKEVYNIGNKIALNIKDVLK